MMKGWKSESARHAMAAKGMKTGRKKRLNLETKPIKEKMKIISKDCSEKYTKCGGCNDETSTKYSFKGQQGKRWENGLCANCFLEMIAEEKMTVEQNQEKMRK